MHFGFQFLSQLLLLFVDGLQFVLVGISFWESSSECFYGTGFLDEWRGVMPVMKVGSGVFYSFFFPDEVLAEVVPMSPRWNSHLFRIAEYPTLEGVTPLPEDAPAMHWIPPVNVNGLLIPMLIHGIAAGEVLLSNNLYPGKSSPASP